MFDRTPCVYILASRHDGRLYVGVTSSLAARIVQHRAGTFGGHTAKYDIKRLVYFEVSETIDEAIRREKQMKRWHRDWKRNVIKRANPAWNDLAVMFGLDPWPSAPSGPVDPGTSPG